MCHTMEVILADYLLDIGPDHSIVETRGAGSARVIDQR